MTWQTVRWKDIGYFILTMTIGVVYICLVPFEVLQENWVAVCACILVGVVVIFLSGVVFAWILDDAEKV